MRPALRQARKTISHDTHSLPSSIATFLCPALLRAPLAPRSTLPQRLPSPKTFSTFRSPRQQFAVAEHDAPEPQLEDLDSNTTLAHLQALPRACPGCGAPTQLHHRKEAGCYQVERRQVKAYLNHELCRRAEKDNETNVYTKVLKAANLTILAELGVDKDTLDAPNQAEDNATKTPVCNRCHELINYHAGKSIHHPSVHAISQTIAESPHRRNHIYHIIDAADFPLSLVPNLQSSLHLPKLRTQNRRAKHKGWVANNRIAEVSFIVTRADLLAPLKEQVDKLLPYMQDVLRSALGRENKTARLGNVHLVSAQRGWWTKKVKEDIWDRGGAGWMVGKVNVGKSRLFDVVLPKGRGSNFQYVGEIRSAAEREKMLQAAKSLEELTQVQKQLDEEDAEVERRRRQPVPEPEDVLPEENDEDFDENSLLPPRQPYTPFPVTPLVSSLPGTTASPIRIPFGRNRGELIDLPGLARTTPDLSTFVRASERDHLVMKRRIAADRYVLRPGQSLVLGGGLIRITPVTEDLIFLVHPFVPLDPHITSTAKAMGLQDQSRDSGVPSILVPNVSERMKSAGTFKLRWDATKKLAGPLTSAIAGKMKPENLPFTIWSTDILIEGVGWVEVSAQVRKPKGWKPVGMLKKDPNHAKIERERGMEEERRRKEMKFAALRGDAFDQAGLGGSERSRHKDERNREAAESFIGEMAGPYPKIEVFSPLGKFIGARMPMCSSLLGGLKPVSSRKMAARPRRSMASIRGIQVKERKERRRETSG